MLANLEVVPVTVHINNGMGGATLVAYPMSESGNITHVVDARQVLISVAQCSEKDHYDRKLGRNLAISRAADEGFVLRFPKKFCEMHKIQMLRQMAAIYAGFVH